MLGHVFLSVIFFSQEFAWAASVSLNQAVRVAQKNNHQNISILLDSLLSGYDNSIRPDFGEVWDLFQRLT
nr:unnamed protein product [Callosobruchus analis]